MSDINDKLISRTWLKKYHQDAIVPIIDAVAVLDDTKMDIVSGDKGQVLGFINNDEIGAVDITTSGGGGAIPAYIVGDTMTSGWLSLTDGGDALTPVDKQEYVILSSGDWLRKHVMWFEDIQVYRLTGKVGVVTETQGSYSTGESTETKNISGSKQIAYGAYVVWDSVIAKENGVIEISVDMYTSAQADGMAIVIQLGGVDVATKTNPTMSGNASVATNLTKTVTITDADVGKTLTVGIRSIKSSGNGTLTGSITQNAQEIFTDYETDDVIDITEAEIDQIWGETYGEVNPTNNVFSESEMPWGVWIDGKTIYRKTINTGAMPNNGTKSVPHGISNLGDVIKIEGALKNADNMGVSLPFAGVTNSIEVGYGTTNLTITDKTDYSAFSGYVTIYYTKTTD